MAAAGTTGDSADSTKRIEGGSADQARFCRAFLGSFYLGRVRFRKGREYPGSLWNHLKTRLFPLHRCAPFHMDLERITEGLLP